MMSAIDPPLQERVYVGLKTDYLEGLFVPGKRIDLQNLANRHRSSKTPVREAAFILVGEGLLAHHPDGGFLVPILEPLELIDLLAWHMQLLMTILSNVKETPLRRALQEQTNIGRNISAVSLATRATEIFCSMAQATGNSLASVQVRRLNERLHYSRIAQTLEPALAEKELDILIKVDVVNFPKAMRRRVESYHARKIAHQRTFIHAKAARN